MRLPLHAIRFAVSACLALIMPIGAHAQSLSYGDADSGTSAEDGDSDADRQSRGRGSDYGVRVIPYIEAAQIVTADLSPGNDVLTYSRIAAGGDASVNGRNNGASVSVRYEHYFGWGRKADDVDTISGIARGYATLTPGLQIEAGAMAGRSRVESSGAAVLGPLADSSDVTNIYSIYAGPTVKTRAGDVQVDGGYRIGYTRVDSPDALIVAPGQMPVDVFDESTTHNATMRAVSRAGELLPVGVTVAGGYYREDISNLDQRVEDFNVRADLSVPVGHDVALLAGIGYEDVTVSSRDARRDANGLPIVGPDGRYVTDKSGPRRIALDTSGLTWDAGVIWRPSRRTELEAHVGRRYGSTSYYGSFTYAPTSRSSVNLSVYDSVSGFGGQVNRALGELPVQFTANRDILSGNITGCVAATEGNNCLSGVLGSVRSSTFRARGVKVGYNAEIGRITTGFGLGYDRRRFLAARGTILEAANGLVDENIWLAGYLNARLSERSSLSTQAHVNWFLTGEAFGRDARAIGVTTSYGHKLTEKLSAMAALGIDGVLRDNPLLEDYWTASALLGVRYSF
ncbi:MAG: preprotein translocase subunit YajC [Novosphingobium sp.]